MTWTIEISVWHIVQAFYALGGIWTTQAAAEEYRRNGAREAALMAAFFLVVTWGPLTVLVLAGIGAWTVVA